MKLSIYLFLLVFCGNISTHFDHGPHVISSKKQLKQFEKNYKYIPSGTLHINKDEEYSVQGFYMFNTEITNLQYREFIADLKRTDDHELLEKVQVDPSNWDNEPFEKTYHIHPAYESYPVLNIDHASAVEYCKWLEEMLAKSYQIDKDRLTVRLPSREEWMYAAKGGHSYAPYPWGGYYLRNAKGCFLANFNKAIGEGNITLDQETGEYKVVNPSLAKQFVSPSPVESFFPNDYGLYNMSGNVAEMILEYGVAVGGSWNSTGYDIRIESKYQYDGPNPYVGFRPVVIFNE